MVSIILAATLFWSVAPVSAQVRSDSGADGATMPILAASFARYVGAYANAEEGVTLNITIEGDKLLAQLFGRSPVTLVPTADGKFDVEGAGATLEFSSGEGPAAEATIRQRGHELVLKRTP